MEGGPFKEFSSMCYSALVNHDAKNLRTKYDAEIVADLFEDLFVSRLQGSGAKIPRAMEEAFLRAPKNASDLRIAKAIRDFRRDEAKRLQVELRKQEKRLAGAEKTLKTKTTKKASEDRRIATEKIESLKFKIDALENGAKITERDSRIFPGIYAPLIVGDPKGKRLIRPFRYHLRPHGQPASFDRRFAGTYNARRDSLEEKAWWRSLYGKNHGVLEIRAFFENVGDPNVVLRFEPEALDRMLVPCIFDRNEKDRFTLDSFALITDEPNPEVAAAGHDRTPIIMREKYLDLWLQTAGRELAAYETVFEDKQPTYFEHSVAA